MFEIMPDKTYQLMALQPILEKGYSNSETNIVLSACSLRETFPSPSIFTHFRPSALWRSFKHHR